MRDDHGVVSFDRELLKSPLWLGEPFSRGQAWLDLVGRAVWRPYRGTISGQAFFLERGQLAWSTRLMAQRWQWSRGKVMRFLKMLENAGEIRLDQLQTRKRTGDEHGANPLRGQADGPANGPATSVLTTVITIRNYDSMQVGGPPTEPASGPGNGPPNETLTDQRRTNKKQEEAGVKKQGGDDSPASLADFEFYLSHESERFGRLAGKQWRELAGWWIDYRRTLGRGKRLSRIGLRRMMLDCLKVLDAGGNFADVSQRITEARTARWTGWCHSEWLADLRGAAHKNKKTAPPAAVSAVPVYERMRKDDA